MKTFNPDKMPNLDDSSKENFDRTTEFIDYICEIASKEKEDEK